MPPGYVKTIREEIFYEYAKLISCTSCHDAHASNVALFFTNESLSPKTCVRCATKKVASLS
jgi:predicted CXXCH cytochrome family protein